MAASSGIESGNPDQAIRVDEGLLIDPADVLVCQRRRYLALHSSRTLALEFVVGFFVGLLFRAMTWASASTSPSLHLQRLEPFPHRLQVMP